MEPVGDLLKGTPTDTNSSSKAVRTDDIEICPHCGAEVRGEWVPFPPVLAAKYGRDGQLWFPPCSPECERAGERREWEIQTRKRKAASLLEKSEMPERLTRCTLDTFDASFSKAAERGFDRVKEYLEHWTDNRDAGRGLYLCGGVGSGKTHLSSGLAHNLIRAKHVPVLFHTAPELLDRLRPSEEHNREDWASWAMNAELLILDDLGAEKSTEWARERLFVLVNHRYRRSLPTVYTSNVGPRELGGHLGERTASRIVETSEFVLVDGPDYRVETRKVRRG